MGTHANVGRRNAPTEHQISKRGKYMTSGSEVSAEMMEQAWSDPRLANVLYHDWEASTYDEKW